MFFLALISTILVLVLTILHLSQRRFNFWKDKNVKFVKPIPFFGNYKDYMMVKVNIGDVAKEICEQLPDEPLVGAFYGTKPVLLVQDPELIKLVMIKDYYYFNAREVSDYCHKEVLTRNMFFTYGDNWRVLRQNLTPLFSSARMKSMFYLVEKCTRVYEKLLDKEVRKSQVQDVRALAIRYTMDCICSAAFGIDTNVMGEEVESNPFRKMGDAIFDASFSRGIKSVFRAVWPDLFYKLGLVVFPVEAGKFFTTVLYNVFKERNYTPTSRQDFVDLVLTLKNQNYISGDSIKNMKDNSTREKIKMKVDDDFLVSQCMLFFAAGFETSAGTSAFVLYELAKSPKDLERVLREVDAYMSKRSIVQFDCTTELPFLEQCIDEALRLYPILPVTTREVYEDYTFPNGVKVKKDMRIHIPTFRVHQNPKYFEDPTAFKPERFSPENKKNIIPCSYFPFGDGPRTCVGMRFAKMQILAGLVTFLKKYRVELAEGTPLKLELEPSAMVIQSKDQISLKLIEREGWEQRVYK